MKTMDSACSCNVACLTRLHLYISRMKQFSSENVRLKKRVETLETENKWVWVPYQIFSQIVRKVYKDETTFSGCGKLVYFVCQSCPNAAYVSYRSLLSQLRKLQAMLASSAAVANTNRTTQVGACLMVRHTTYSTKISFIPNTKSA